MCFVTLVLVLVPLLVLELQLLCTTSYPLCLMLVVLNLLSGLVLSLSVFLVLVKLLSVGSIVLLHLVSLVSDLFDPEDDRPLWSSLLAAVFVFVVSLLLLCAVLVSLFLLSELYLTFF